jgi:pimeloyl-ACP methyl ester carboxylesterase
VSAAAGETDPARPTRQLDAYIDPPGAHWGHGFLRRPVPAAQQAIAGALEDWDAFALLTSLTVPAVAIHGTRRPPGLRATPDDVRDFLVAVMDSIDADLEALSERNAAAQVVLVPEAGHMVHLEAAEAVAGHVATFVAQL